MEPVRSRQSLPARDGCRDTEPAMSRENVETVKRYTDLLNQTREPPAELCDPEIELHTFRGSPIAGPYHGYEGLRQWRADTFDVIADWRLELDEVITGDDPDVMVILQRFVGRTVHTDLAVDFPLAVVVRFRDGRLWRFEGYRKRVEALEAAGLQE